MTLNKNNSIKSIINIGEQQLADISDSAKLDAQVLLGFVLNKDISYLYTWPEEILLSNQTEQFFALLTQRKQGEPIAYLVGVKEFWSLNFFVSPATLIPRPDTECLVELVLEQHDQTNLQCLDLGTGTGAIALAIASERESWQITAIDYSDEAVELAKRNAKQLKFTAVDVFQSDWFQSIDSKQEFDLIVSNPPYIDPLDEHLQQGDVRFEPLSALVASDKGLADISLIIKQAKSYLIKGGWLYFEHGYQQGKAVRALFNENGYHKALTVQDYNGNDRITYAHC